MATVQRIVRRPDGEVEVFIPARNRDGMYTLAKRDADYRNEAANQIEVPTEAELVELAKTGEYWPEIKVTRTNAIRLSCIQQRIRDLRQLDNPKIPTRNCRNLEDS